MAVERDQWRDANGWLSVQVEGDVVKLLIGDGDGSQFEFRVAPGAARKVAGEILSACGQIGAERTRRERAERRAQA